MAAANPTHSAGNVECFTKIYVVRVYGILCTSKIQDNVSHISHTTVRNETIRQQNKMHLMIKTEVICLCHFNEIPKLISCIMMCECVDVFASYMKVTWIFHANGFRTIFILLLACSRCASFITAANPFSDYPTKWVVPFRNLNQIQWFDLNFFFFSKPDVMVFALTELYLRLSTHVVLDIFLACMKEQISNLVHPSKCNQRS